MTDLSDFPVTRLVPPAHPDRLQLYSWPTPNGVKVSIMLEETGLPYEAHRVAGGEDGTGSAAYRAIQPVGKIPAILDPDGPGGKPIAVFESGAILLYLADKTGRLIGADPAERMEAIQWVFWQNAGLGPMLGQFGFLVTGDGKDWEDKRPRDRYIGEAKRLLDVLNRRLAGRAWIMGDEITIADIATFPWVRNLIGFYGAGELVAIAGYPEVTRVLEAFLVRPAVQRGLLIPAPPTA